MSEKNDKKVVIGIMVVLGVMEIAVVVMAVLFFWNLTRPYKGYTGEYPQLFTVAVRSIPGARGYIPSEVPHQPAISLIEEDSFGRQMFCYCESVGDDAVIYLFVCHGFDDENAYYYEGAYTYAAINGNPHSRIHLRGEKYPAQIEYPMLDFTDVQVEILKEANDWNSELNLSKCTKAPIVRKVEKNIQEK